MKLKLRIKKNKSNGQLFVNIPRNCGLTEEHYVEVDKYDS